MQSLNVAEPMKRAMARMDDIVAVNERVIAQQHSVNREPGNFQKCTELHPAAPLCTMASIFENPYVALLDRELLRKFDLGISKLFEARMKKAPDSQVIAMMEAILVPAEAIRVTLAQQSDAIALVRRQLCMVRDKQNGKRSLDEPSSIPELFGKNIGVHPAVQLAIDHATQLTDPNTPGMLGSEWSVDGAYMAMHGNCDEEVCKRDISVCVIRLVSAHSEMTALHNVALDTKERLMGEIERLKQLKE